MKLTHEQLKNMKPCRSQYDAAIRALGDNFTADASEARSKGVSMSDVIWVASSLARNDKSIDRKLRMWIADCAARVLYIYEKTETYDAPRNAIIAARQFANGEIDDAARDAAWAAARAAALDAAGDAARAAAWAAARDAAEKWQYGRLCEWLSDNEPDPLPLGESA